MTDPSTAAPNDQDAWAPEAEKNPLLRALRALYPPDQEREADAVTQYMHGCFDVLGILIAALAGRGLVEAHNLRLDLLGAARMWREMGLPIRALPLEHESANLTKIIEARAQASRCPPPQTGRA